MMRTCVECGCEFDARSPAKRRVGGLATNCVDCSEETVVRYAGVSAGEGKQGSVQVLKFGNAQDREKYLAFWKNNSGLYKGKSCQMGATTTLSMDRLGGQKIGEFGGNPNHKGKM